MENKTAPTAYWASWAHALPMLKARLPSVAAQAVQILDGGLPSGTCLDEVSEAGRLLDREGFLSRPSFAALAGGARPPEPVKPEFSERRGVVARLVFLRRFHPGTPPPTQCGAAELACRGQGPLAFT